MSDAATEASTFANAVGLSPGTFPFVGRDAEFAVLAELLDRSLAGAGQVALLAGEPGIGKTRTTERLVDLARERGALALWGNCHEWAGAPAFWPWAQALRGWLRGVTDDELGAALGSGAALVAQVAPEIAERLSNLPPLPRLEPEARLFQVLAATGNAIRAMAIRQPLVIVLEDIHWADNPSLQLLRFLAQEIRDAPVLLVATYRESEVGRRHPATAALADLTREPNCRRVTLQGLPKPQVARFVALATGQVQAPSLVDALHEETLGNPFFVTEVVRLLLSESPPGDGSHAGSRRPQVPETVRSAVRQRLDRLSAGCNALLLTASVVGREFSLSVLERVIDRPAAELLDAVTEAVQAHFLVPGEATGVFRFSHALVQETLQHELPLNERARLHLAVGHALEALSVGREPHWAELSHHFQQAMPLGDPRVVCEYAARAGETAAKQLSWEAAAFHFRNSLEAFDMAGTIDDTRRCDLLLGLGEAEDRSGPGSGDVPRARDSFAEAYRLARALGDAERAARAAIGHAGQNIATAFGGAEQIHMLEEALAGLGPEPSPLRVRVLGRLAVTLFHVSANNGLRARDLSDEAVAVAERLDDPPHIAYALWSRIFAWHLPDGIDQRIADAARLVEVAEQLDDPFIVVWSHHAQRLNFLETGNLAAAERVNALAERFTERAHAPYVAQRTAAGRATLELAAGRYDAAAKRIDRAEEIWGSSTPYQHQCLRFHLLRDTGRLGEFQGDIELPLDLCLWGHATRAHRMLLALDRDQIDSARVDYDTLVADSYNFKPKSYQWYSVTACLTEAAIAFGDTTVAEQVYVSMSPYDRLFLANGTLALCHGPATLYLGRLATALGRWPEAEQHLSRAIETCERAGFKPYAARALLALAEMHACRDGAGDRRMAREIARRALDSAHAFGMHGLDAPVREILDRVAPLRATGFGLTAREREVLVLVAGGLTDAEVADRLFISTRTVSQHLRSVYNKLGVSSRVAAVRTADEHGLI